MDFGQALKLLREGKNLLRKDASWRYCYIYMVGNAIAKRDPDASAGLWFAHSDDLVAEDWEICEWGHMDECNDPVSI